MPRNVKEELVWTPTHRQIQFLAVPWFEVLFGGSRGGGKTDAVIGDFLQHQAVEGKHAVGLVIRRERTQLIETITRAEQIYAKVGARWMDKDKCFQFKNGARLYFGYLEHDGDADVYQGWNLTRLYVEEMGNFRAFAPIAKLFATLRSPAGVSCKFKATANPGGAGHNWIKARYIEPWPRGDKRLVAKIKNPINGDVIIRDRGYVPSRVTDNPFLGQDYVANLVMSGAGSAALVRAWLEGDWDAIEGAFFHEWSAAKHICMPFEIPTHWTRFRSIDWGTAKPFSVGWWAVASDDTPIENGRIVPRGAMVRYREWYGCEPGKPNTGLKLSAATVARGVVERSRDENIDFTVIDPAVFANTGGQTIGEAFAANGVECIRADNTRVARSGAMSGWNNIRQRLEGDGDRPYLFVFDTCRDTIRTLPVIQHDKNRAEDVDTEAEDHAVDEIRYACAARPWITKANVPPPPIADHRNMSIEALFQAARN